MPASDCSPTVAEVDIADAFVACGGGAAAVSTTDDAVSAFV